MIKPIITILFYISIFFNSNLMCDENNKELKIGLLAPFSGVYKNLGESLLLSTQLALSELNNKKIIIIPRDSGSNDKEKLNIAIQEIISSGAKIIIGPPDSEDFEEIKKYKDMIFISLSNKESKIENNIISIGISLESQIKTIEDFIIKQKKKKTIIMYPKNDYTKFIDERIKLTKLKNYKIFKYNPDPKILTGEIEKLTNYSQRKRNLSSRIAMLEDKDDEASKRELLRLEQKYTLGKVNFDSVIIIDFGNSLKSVLASLVFSDVNEEDVLFTTVNQWFDESIFYENSVKSLYYPSIDFANFKKHNNKYYKTFQLYPNEITILAYDALGLIYYVWNKNNKINSINDFFLKEKIKGKIGSFNFNEKKVTQELKIYKAENKKFKEF
ncbi:MAG: ABC transporter substrate-binding protein [Pelagibacteraceae bacterium]